MLSLCFPAGFLQPRHYKTCMTRAWGFNQSCRPVPVAGTHWRFFLHCGHFFLSCRWGLALTVMHSGTVSGVIKPPPKGTGAREPHSPLEKSLLERTEAVKSPAAVEEEEEGRTRSAGLRACGSRWPLLTYSGNWLRSLFWEQLELKSSYYEESNFSWIFWD